MIAPADAAGGKQSGRMSLVEAIANVTGGYRLGGLTQRLVFPIVGVNIPLSQNLAVGLLFTVTSFTRWCALRGLFDGLRAQDR